MTTPYLDAVVSLRRDFDLRYFVSVLLTQVTFCILK